jgi:hypothetical protein
MAATTLFCVFASNHAASASFSTDQSDLWWVDPPGSENGWGLQLIQRSSTIFATMFVYSPSSVPTWYVSTMVPAGASLQWSGDLYTTTGPWFGAVPYNPANLTVRKVGTMSWTASSGLRGVLSYTVDGVAVNKNLIRQTLVSENYGGHFAGAFHQTNAGCANPDFNGTFDQTGVLNVVQNGSAVTMTFFQPEEGGSCLYGGILTQYGQMGDVVGTYSCTSGFSGFFHIFELQVTQYSLTGRLTTSNTVPAGCQASGWFGGTTVTTF